MTGGRRTTHGHVQVGLSEVRSPSGDTMVLGNMALLAGEIAPGAGHVDIKISIGRGPMGQSHVSPFVVVAPAAFGMALEAVGPYRSMDRLDGLIHGDGHVDRVRNKDTIDLLTFVIFLVAGETIDILQLGRGRGWIRLGAKTDMAGTTGVPVAQNSDAVTVKGRVHLALGIGAVDGVQRRSGPLVVTGAVHFLGLGCMAGQTGLGTLPGQPGVGGRPGCAAGNRKKRCGTQD